MKLQHILFETALMCKSLGIVTVPTNNSKRAVVKWRSYQSAAPSIDEMERTFGYSITEGIAILCGSPSGNIEVVDVDCKNDLGGNLMKRFYTLIKEANPDLAAKLVIASTRSGGYHLFYRWSGAEPSIPLACRAATAEELKRNAKLLFRVLIETRADKGMACIAPTPGYQFIRGDLHTIPTITDEERQIIVTAAVTLNQFQPRKKEVRAVHRKVPIDHVNSPIDDYNRRGDIVSLLKKHGWRVVGEKDDKTELLRPGDTDKSSSGNFNHKMRLFSTFSTSTDFQPSTPYSPTEVFSILECNSDKHAAVKRLLADGFGKSYVQERREASLRMKK